MAPAFQANISLGHGNPSFKGFANSVEDISTNPQTASRGKANLPSGGPYSTAQSYAPNNNYFENKQFEDVNPFFDFEPRSGTTTPRKELSSRVPFDFANSWNSFQPLSPPASGVLPSDDWQTFEQANVPHNILTQIDPSRVRSQYGQTTPPEEDLPSTLEFELTQQQIGLPSPPSSSSSKGTKRKQSSADTTESPEVSAPPKRMRKSYARSLKNGGCADPNDPEGARRSKFLERNRVAASKCRQKKKEWTQNLETKARDLQRHNNELRMIVDSCKEEILFLKGEMLKHTACGCSTIQDYLQRGLDTFSDHRDSIVKQETSPVGSAPPSPGGSISSYRQSDGAVPTSATHQTPGRWERTVEENLEALLQPQYDHNTSPEGISSQLGS